MENIFLRSIKVAGKLVCYKFEVSPGLKPFFTTDCLFVEYDRDMSEVPLSILSIPFVSSVIPLIWLTNSILWVHELDRTYYDSLKALRAAYQANMPGCALGGRLVSNYLVNNCFGPDREETHGAILLFSGGLDAHVSYIRHHKESLTLMNIQGWLPRPEDESDAQRADFSDTAKFANAQGKDASLVKSNFATIIDIPHLHKRITRRLHMNYWHDFQHSIAFIGIAIPVALQRNTPRIYIASSYTVGRRVFCASLPDTDNEHRFAGTGHVVHDGFELSRQDKVAQLVEYQQSTGKSYPIRVCSFNDRNDCVCPKCFRTITAIVAEGGDPTDFGFELPLDKVAFYENYVRNHWIEFGIEKEAVHYWPATKKRMVENMEAVQDKKFAEWFLKKDFVGERHRAVRRYRIKNFFKLVWKRLKQ